MKVYNTWYWASIGDAENNQSGQNSITTTVHVPPGPPITAQAALARVSTQNGQQIHFEAQAYISDYAWHSGAGNHTHHFQLEDQTSAISFDLPGMISVTFELLVGVTIGAGYPEGTGLLFIGAN
jgi:hypothetical protein